MTLLGALSAPLVGVAQDIPMVTEQDISGAIIATQEDRVSVGEGDTVILDQGRQRGIIIGDRFAVFQDSRTVVHPLTGRLIRIAREVIGELAVVTVHEQTSMAVLINSIREVNAGAPIASLRLAALRQQESRTEVTESRTQVETRLGRLSPCLEMTRQAVGSARGRAHWPTNPGGG
jgi:hypothetical protein